MSEWTGTQGEAYDKIDRYLRKNLWCDDYAEFSCALKILWDTPPDDVAELVEALKAAGLFVHHCWCDVPMNEYSSKKLDETMAKIDAALAAAKDEVL